MHSNQGAGLASTFTSTVGVVITWTWDLNFKTAPSQVKAMTILELSSSRGITRARPVSATGLNPTLASMMFFIGATGRAKAFGGLGRLMSSTAASASGRNALVNATGKQSPRTSNSPSKQLGSWYLHECDTSNITE